MVTSRSPDLRVLDNSLATASSIHRQRILADSARADFSSTVSEKLGEIGRFKGAPPQIGAGTLESRSILAAGVQTGQIPVRDADVASTFQNSARDSISSKTVSGAYHGASSAGPTGSNVLHSGSTMVGPTRGKSTPSLKPGGHTH